MHELHEDGVTPLVQKFPKLTDDVDNLKTPPLKKGDKGGFSKRFSVDGELLILL